MIMIQNLNEARYIILQKYSDMKPDSVFEYENLYVFSLNYRKDNKKQSMDNLIAVDRQNGETFIFLPLNYDADKYLEAVRNTLQKL